MERIGLQEHIPYEKRPESQRLRRANQRCNWVLLALYMYAAVGFKFLLVIQISQAQESTDRWQKLNNGIHACSVFGAFTAGVIGRGTLLLYR